MTAHQIINSLEHVLANASRLKNHTIEEIVIGADIWLADNVFDIELDDALKIEQMTDSLRGLIDFYAA